MFAKQAKADEKHWHCKTFKVIFMDLNTYDYTYDFYHTLAALSDFMDKNWETKVVRRIIDVTGTDYNDEDAFEKEN